MESVAASAMKSCRKDQTEMDNMVRCGTGLQMMNTSIIESST